MKKLNNWFKMQWELYFFTDSVDAMNMPQWKFDKEIKKINEK